MKSSMLGNKPETVRKEGDNKLLRARETCLSKHKKEGKKQQVTLQTQHCAHKFKLIGAPVFPQKQCDNKLSL